MVVLTPLAAGVKRAAYAAAMEEYDDFEEGPLDEWLEVTAAAQ